mmetsp:Transcript_63604/g.125284  ORF Transcript_63604/g.125284 Transcript_63604/m.125284 type:complete len:583 (+) Transcript_63604:41-1789(+)
MGAHTSSQNQFTDITTRLEARCGKIPLSGRYHKHPRKIDDDYEVCNKVLGSGYNGVVRMATFKHTKQSQKFAVKAFKLSGLVKDKRAQLESEVEIFLCMDHPHITRLYDVYESDDLLFLVMECCEGGELFDRVTELKRFSERDAADAVWQMLLAVNYLHTHGIVHRDLKLENFLYDSKARDYLKLIDFGFSKMWDPNIKMHVSCGTLSYVAPEVLQKSYTSQCDMWSLGVIIFILLSGYMPFSGSEENQIKHISEGTYKMKPERWDSISTKAREFTTSLLRVDPAKRLTAEKALEHPWIADRLQSFPAALDTGILESVRSFSRASQFQRTVLSMMAWSLSAGDRSELRKQFLQIDADKNGTISLKEFTDVMANRFNVCGREAEAMFKCIDTDDNNEIEYNEFLAVAVQHEPEHQDLLRQTFARFDADGDGVITRCELRSTLGDTFSQDEVAGVLQAADTSGDGKLSFEEFLAFFTGAGDVACSRPQRDEGQSPPSTAETLSPAASEEKEQSAAEAIAHPPATAGPRPEATQDLLGAHEKAPVRRKAGAPSTPGCFPTLGSGGPLPVLLTSIQAGLRSGKPAA